MPDRPRKPEAIAGARAPKTCQRCGRTMTWRKSWARNWDDVKFCSDRCRATPTADPAQQLEQAILALLAARGAGKTICPSEAARVVAPTAWQPLMEPARAAARRLVAQGKLLITQAGHVVDPSTAKGPIRLRLR